MPTANETKTIYQVVEKESGNILATTPSPLPRVSKILKRRSIYRGDNEMPGEEVEHYQVIGEPEVAIEQQVGPDPSTTIFVRFFVAPNN